MNDGSGTLLPQSVFSSINFSFHYSISCSPIGGSTCWWPLLSSASMTKVNILLDYLFHSLSQSFPPSLLSSPTLSTFSSSFTLTPSWFCPFFSVSEMKASPQLLSLLLKRTKWGSLSDERSPLPLQTDRDTEFHTYMHVALLLACTVTTLAHIAV